MRAGACVAMFVVMLSPLTSLVCEFNCLPAMAPAPVSAQLSCHESGHATHDPLRPRLHPCGSVHQHGMGLSATPGAVYRTGAVVGAAIAVVDGPRLSIDLSVLSRPPGRPSLVSSVSSPPLRI